MPRATLIDKLPKEVREEINRWRIEDHLTIDEIIEKLKAARGIEIKRATMGLHVQKLEQVGERIRELRAVSEGLAKAVGEGDSQKVNSLNRELAHSLLMRLQVAKDGDGKDVHFGPMDVMFISKALDHLAHAEKLDSDRAIMVRREVGKEVKKKIDGIVADATASEGAKPDAAAVLRRIREEVYGIFEEPKK